jgi:hypothetical protein
MFKFTKTQGPWANFGSDCYRCGGELTVSNGRPDPHTCDFRARNLEAVREQLDKPITLADIRAALDNRQAR